MNKARIEMLSDGVFAIVMTLLVLDLKVPEGAESVDAELVAELMRLGPVFTSYFVTFTVLAMFWIMHHATFHFVLKSVDRVLLPISLLYLAFLALLPFSAHLLGAHLHATAAAMVYGGNVLAIGLVSLAMFHYGASRAHVRSDALSDTLYRQARVRQWIVPVFSILGICAAPLWIPLALFLYAFPVVFNIIPGMLGALEKAILRR